MLAVIGQGKRETIAILTVNYFREGSSREGGYIVIWGEQKMTENWPKIKYKDKMQAGKKGMR